MRVRARRAVVVRKKRIEREIVVQSSQARPIRPQINALPIVLLDVVTQEAQLVVKVNPNAILRNGAGTHAQIVVEFVGQFLLRQAALQQNITVQRVANTEALLQRVTIIADVINRICRRLRHIEQNVLRVRRNRQLTEAIQHTAMTQVRIERRRRHRGHIVRNLIRKPREQLLMRRHRRPKEFAAEWRITCQRVIPQRDHKRGKDNQRISNLEFGIL